MGSKRFCLGRWNDGLVLRATRLTRGQGDGADGNAQANLCATSYVRPRHCLLPGCGAEIRTHPSWDFCEKTANTFPAITELVALLEKPASTAMFENMRLAVLRRAAALHA
ncbi:hypothetical protein XAUB_04460 [Xanthomonas citri pv. aurantifolii str. ICPB 11122]|nr:hypothetical protein XcvCFBP7113P_16515 [Xanthomonas citri pv. vignicola]EFF45455.1 hypothetical protein XAUB_04460 [Xanthomonas citri pv. aurantifolii str. ICPB 11122]EFF48232.1 hypothetical protein XAUC_13970 [Xanthomonas citri pv. aurantifolii str. ICPB 10535]